MKPSLLSSVDSASSCSPFSSSSSSEPPAATVSPSPAKITWHHSQAIVLKSKMRWQFLFCWQSVTASTRIFRWSATAGYQHTPNVWRELSLHVAGRVVVTAVIPRAVRSLGVAKTQSPGLFPHNLREVTYNRYNDFRIDCTAVCSKHEIEVAFLAWNVCFMVISK